MKMPRLSSNLSLVLIVSALTLTLTACSEIVLDTDENQELERTPTSSPTAIPSQPSEPSEPTRTPTPTPTAAAIVTAAPELPPASWQQIIDLPRHVNALVADPANPQVLYAGTGSTGAGSGVFKSEDAGQTWQKASNGLPNEDVVALAFSRGDPPILYAAVGDSVFASADGGASWTQHAQGVGNYRGFERLRVAPGDGRRLYGVAVIEGVFRSDDGGHNWLAINEGLPQDGNGSLNAQTLAVDPANPDVVYLGTGWGPFGGNGVFKSTDGGATWMPVNRGMMDYSITALAVDPTDPQIVYAGGNDGELFKSNDGGESWEFQEPSADNPGGIREIIVDPAMSETLYLLFERAGGLVSRDGGANWQALGKPGEIGYSSFTEMAIVLAPRPVLVVGTAGAGGWRYGASQAPPTPTPTAPPATSASLKPTPLPGFWQSVPDLPQNINALVADPLDSQVLYAGTGFAGAGSGVFKSEDAGQTWQKASDGLPNEDVVALAFSRGDPPVLYAAVGDSVFASTDGGASWTQHAQGVGNYRGFERLRVAPGDGRRLYGVAVIEGVFRSDDGGHNWLAINEGLPQDGNGSLNAQTLAVDPANPDVVYLGTGWGPFGGNGVFKSTDGGVTWAAANRGMMDYSITALAVDPTDPQIVYAGGNDGELFKSNDGGGNWDDLTASLPFQEHSSSAILDIAIDPTAPETMYLLFERDGVLASYDGGTGWRLLGKPGEPQHPSFTAMVVIFDAQPILVAGIRDSGGWRYAVD